MESGAASSKTRSSAGESQDASSKTMCAVSTDCLRPSVLTSTPRRRSALTRCRPMNPCPPVTTALRMTQKCVAIFLEHLLGKREIVRPPDIKPNAIVLEANHTAIAGFDLQQQVRHVQIIDLRHMGPHGLPLENIHAHADKILAGRLLPIGAKPVPGVEFDQSKIDLVFPLINSDRSVGVLGDMAQRHTAEIHRGEQVTVRQEECFVQKVEHIPECACGAERFILVAIVKPHPEFRTVAKIRFN